MDYPLRLCPPKKNAKCKKEAKICNPLTGRCVSPKNKKATNAIINIGLSDTIVISDLFTVVMLRKKLKSYGVKGYSGKNRQALVEMLAKYLDKK